MDHRGNAPSLDRRARQVEAAHTDNHTGDATLGEGLGGNRAVETTRQPLARGEDEAARARDDLRARGVPERALDAIALVSRNLHDELDYDEAIRLVATSLDATLVKISDNAHNSRPDRVAALVRLTGEPENPRYARVREVLYAAAPTDAGLLATVKAQKPAEWTTDAITPAEGAEFNVRICGEYGSSNSDNSKGVHNPFLCDALLTSSISYIKSYYGLPAVTASQRVSMEGSSGGSLNQAIQISRPHSGQ